MSLTQELDDSSENLGSKIILSHEAFDDESNIKTKNSSQTKQLFLRVGKPGKLFLQPNYTAFTKTTLGSIPSKIEKTLLKTEESIPITFTLNKNISNIKNTTDEQIFKDPRSYTTSFSSKGYGVGFVSQAPRFNKDKKSSYPGPGEYFPDKLLSVENNINKSNFGKSIFLDKTSKSLQILNISDNKFCTSQEILNNLKNKYNNRYNKNFTNNSYSNIDDTIMKEDKKGNYFFESKVKKFNGGFFNTNNKNPGPGKYFLDTNFKIKNKNKKSPDFIEPIKKKESPVKTFGLNNNDEKKIGFELVENKKNGKIFNFWNGPPSLGFSYDFGKTLKNKKNKKIENHSSENNIKHIPDYEASKILKNLGKMRFKTKDYLNEKNYSLSEEKYEYKFDNKNNKQNLMIKELLKFRRKDFFGLSPPRWDEGLFHDNGSHFQIPGPAYYDPKVQSLKRSFNLNKKDFIFTNSIPFKEKNFID